MQTGFQPRQCCCCLCYPGEYLRLSICCSSLMHFPERSWAVVAFPYFTVVKSFTSLYALLLLFFLRFSSISRHCFPIQFSLAFFMHLLMLLFTSLYFSDPSGSNLFFFSSLLLSPRSRISAVIEVCFSSDDVCQRSHWLFQSRMVHASKADVFRTMLQRRV